MHPVSRCWLFLQSSPLPRSQSWPPARCHVERVATSTTAALFAHGVSVDLLLFYLFPPFSSSAGAVPLRFPPLPTIPPSHTTEDAPATTKFPPSPFSPSSEPSGLHRIILALVFLGVRRAPSRQGIFRMGWMGWSSVNLWLCRAGSGECKHARSLGRSSLQNPPQHFFGRIWGRGLLCFLAPFGEGIGKGSWGWSSLESCSAAVVHKSVPERRPGVY